jgi:hypothetical protein
MLDKQVLLKELQTLLHNATDDETKIVLNGLIYEIADGRFNIRVW